MLSNSLASIFHQDGLRHLVYRASQYLADRLNSGTVSRSVAGVTAEFNASDARYLGDFHDERDVVASFISDLRTEDVVYDIGANLGIYSSFAGRVLGQSGNVVAVEPNPAALSSLYQNVQRNTNSFEVFSTALSDSTGFGRIPPLFATGGDIRDQAGIRIPISRVDDLMSSCQIPIPDVVKIDVEGAEEDVLRGFGGFLSEVRVLYVEVHREKVENFNSSEHEIRSILEGHFSSLSQIGENTRGAGEQVQLRAATASEQ